MNELATTIGLANLGNTCFLNVVLQALRLSPPLCNIFLLNKIELREKSNKKLLLEGFQTLIQDFWKVVLPSGARPTLAPRGFHNAFIRSIREAEEDWHYHGQQSDAAETIQYIMNGLHDAMYEGVTMRVSGKITNSEEAERVKAIDSWANFFRKEYSPIVEHYNGQTQTCVICKNCGGLSVRYEPWLMLKVPLPGVDSSGPYRAAAGATLTDCLNLAFADESLEDYQCDACKVKGPAKIQNRISKLPDVIILCFKRFTNKMHKVSGNVEWSLENFDFRPWMAFSGDPFNLIYTPPVYETTALIEHQGSFHGGHYRMYAKQPKDADPGTFVWNEYDDNSIRELAGNPGDRTDPCDTYIAFLGRASRVSIMNQKFAENVHALRKKHAPASEA
jgi:ubiquitin C-terminal hydrolase